MNQTPNTKHQKLNNGFTLVELSVVIVIIGLIVAGVVGGQALVRQSKLRAIVSDANQIKTAMNSFKLQYDALPGDIANIQSYYPSIPNGNGNRVMDGTFEDTGFWEVLRIENLYTKYALGVALEFIDTNKITPYGNGALYRIMTTMVYKGSNKEWHLQIGDADVNFRLHQVVKTQETISLDKKFDDGLADSGWIKAGKNYFLPQPVNGCDMGNTEYTGLTATTYNYADTTEKCLIFFRLF